MNDKINYISDYLNVSMHTVNFLDKTVSYAKVKRNTVYIGNVVSKILEHNKIMDRETLLYTADLLRNAIIELLKLGKAVDLLEMGVLNIKPSESIASVNPGIEDIPEMTLSFTPSELAIDAVKNITVETAVIVSNEPVLNSLFNIHTKKEENSLSIGYPVRITGKHMKIAGDETETGIFLSQVSEDGDFSLDFSEWISIGTENIIDNKNTSIMFNIPPDIESGTYRLIIRTAYGSGPRVNKTVRTGVYSEPVILS